MPSWEQVTERAKALGWKYGNVSLPGLHSWYKIVDGQKFDAALPSGAKLWQDEVEGPLWKED